MSFECIIFLGEEEALNSLGGSYFGVCYAISVLTVFLVKIA